MHVYKHISTYHLYELPHVCCLSITMSPQTKGPSQNGSIHVLLHPRLDADALPGIATALDPARDQHRSRLAAGCCGGFGGRLSWEMGM